MKAGEASVTDDDAGEETGSFKEEETSNLVDELEKTALDELKQLIAAAFAAGEFNMPPPPTPPPPKAKEEPGEETKNKEPAKEEPRPKATAVVALAPPAAQQVKTDVPPVEDAKAEAAALRRALKKKITVVVHEKVIEETVVSSPAASEEAAAPETLIWGVPLVGYDDERTDTVLLKFLRAREFRAKEAMEMLKSVVLWRKRFGITSLLDDDLGLPELDKVMFYSGADREGHPVCYNVYGEFQDRDLYEKAFGDDEKRERFLKWRIQLLERGIRQQLDFSPGGICSMVQVTDLKNSPPMLGKHRAVIRQVVTLLMDNYPEFLAKKVFINVPWWYPAVKKMMSLFLTQRTNSKIVFASPETLFRYIAPEQVPVQFGGLYKEDDPEFTTSDSATELTIKPSSKETIEITVTENSTIEWELRVFGWEVSYGAEFIPDVEGGYTIQVQKRRKVPTHEEPIIKGSYNVPELGKLVLTVNNPTPKKNKLLYRSKTRARWTTPPPPPLPLLCSPAIRTAGVRELLLQPLGSIGELSQRPQARPIYSDDPGPPNEWVLDSGAWIHHTSKLELLLEGGDFQEMDNKDAPSSGDDAAAPHVQGRGSVRTDCFDFPGVHYVVGDDTRNVVSVSQLARDHGLVTVFKPTCCHVKDKKTGQIVGKGRLCNGMYKLDSLRIVGQCIGDGGASRGDRRDGADGGSGGQGYEARGNRQGDRTVDGRGEGGTGATNQKEGSGSGASGRDVNEINEKGDKEKETEEMNENEKDDIKEIGETNGKGDKEDDEKRGGQNFGQLSSQPHTGLFGRLSQFTCILWIVILCIAACMSLPYTRWGAEVTILAMDFHSLAGFWVLPILVLQLLKTCMMQSTICKLKLIGSLFQGTSGDGKSKEEKTWGAHLQELSHQEHNKLMFGLSRFDVTTDGYGSRQLPARAFASSTNGARQEDFFVDSGASFHTTWRESILFSYPRYLENHTKPPTLSLGGIAAGSIAVKRTGYLNGNNIMLDGVLLALEAQANLVSVGQLSIYYGVQVEMDDVGVVIKKRPNGVQIGGGRMTNNLYVLEYFLPGGLFAHCPITPHP